MKKSIFLMTIAAFAMVSCNNDEVLELKKDELKFNVAASNASRASELYSSSNLLDGFKVSAYYANPIYDGTNGGTISSLNCYFANDEITYDDENNKWVNKSVETRFWPEDEDLALTFFATNAQTGVYEHLMMRSLAVEHEVEAEVTKQFDLLYAIEGDQTRKNNATTGVNLNFRHALSQIVFNSKNINDGLKIVVKNVSIANLKYKGEMFYRAEVGSTSDNYVTANGDVDVLHPIEWSLTGSPLKTFITDFEDVVLEKKTDGTKDLTVEKEGYAMLMVPQKTIAWDPEVEKYSETKGTYFLVDCEYYNIGYTGENDNKVTNYVPVFKGQIPVSVDFDWQPGKRYIYTLILGAVPSSDPTLIPEITINVTVDDFQETDPIEKNV